jgi:enoyl-CoA hydratase/carnithine racemase
MLVETVRTGHVAVVVFNRPEVRNAIDAETTLALNDVFDDLATDDDVRAVVLTGAGDVAFSAGADMKARVPPTGGVAAGRAANGFAGITRRDFPKPLLAAVNGFALGGGLEIVLACDLVIAEEHATFGLPEVSRGIIAAAGGAVRLATRIPRALALEMGLTGSPISAPRAHEIGLVNRVVGKGEGVSTAVQVAEEICRNAPVAVRVTKQLMRESLDHPEEEMWRRQTEYAKAVHASEDSREGMRAFVEKRAPRWQGH